MILRGRPVPTSVESIFETLARFRGNIWTKARGSIGSITFSEARDRRGKMQTARERVVPINPQTQPQTDARNNLTDSLNIVRTAGAQIYRNDFNRSVSKLPGFQSMMSIFQHSKEVQGSDIVVTSTPPDTPLGDLDRSGWSGAGFGDRTYEFYWAPTATGNQQLNDIPVLIGVQAVYPVASIGSFRSQFRVGNAFGDSRQSGGLVLDFGGYPSGNTDLLAGLYFRPGPDSPVLSPSPVVWQIIPFDGST